MREVPVKNTGKTNLHIAGVVIVPGETKVLPASMVPEKFLPKSAAAEKSDAPPPANAVADLLKGTVAKVSEALPGLSVEDLDAIETTEAAGAQRKGVLEAIAAERLRRVALLEGEGAK